MVNLKKRGTNKFTKCLDNMDLKYGIDLIMLGDTACYDRLG